MNSLIRRFSNGKIAGIALCLLGLDLLFRWKTENILDSTVSELPRRNVSEIDLILVWNQFFRLDFLHNKIGDLDNYMYPGNESLYRPVGCLYRYPNCFVTDRRGFESRADMLLFHWPDLDLNDIPHHRRSEALWTLWSHESPMLVPRRPSTVEIEFNATANYHSSSDIVVLYGWYRKLEQSFAKYEPDLSQKTQSAVWFVSHCRTESRREDYVRELRLHMKVDIWGLCSRHRKCSKFQFEVCQGRIFSRYHFYMSFENAFCDEYATEKIFLALQRDIVPVVYGGANYTDLLPPNSFIDAALYQPSELAALLKSLMANQTRYREYFDWKRHYIIDTDRHQNDRLICGACEYLDKYKRGLVAPKSQSLHDIYYQRLARCWNKEAVDRLFSRF